MTTHKEPDLGTDPLERFVNLLILIAQKITISVQSVALVVGLLFVIIVSFLALIFRFIIPGGR